MIDTLFPYQDEGAEFLAGRTKALLADEMGLGKSAQAISASDRINAQRIVVIAPAVARVNWSREFWKFSPFDRPIQLVDSGKDRIDATGVTICSYDLAVKPGILRQLRDCKPDALVIDECHFLKNPEAQRTKALLGKEGLAHHAKYLWPMSGTPAPNHPGEIWLLLYVFGVYPYQYNTFLKRFCTGYYDGYEFKVTGGKNYGELRQLLAQIMLRRKKDQVMTELPPIHYTDYAIAPGEVDEDLWFEMELRHPTGRQRLLDKLEQEREAVRNVLKHARGKHAFQGLDAIAQSVPTLRRYTGLAKIPGYVDLIKSELEAGMEKIVIFALHRDVIKQLQMSLHDYNPVTLYGGTRPDKRQKMVDRFTNKGKHRVFIGQVIAAGTAINLTVAHNVDFLEADWVPGNNAQAAMRCHRIGQDKPVRVRFIGLANSFDEQVQRALRRKSETLSQIFD